MSWQMVVGSQGRTLTGDCDGCPVPSDGCPGDCPQRVEVDRLPVTSCQPCVLDALTAEGERLGQYWEIGK